MPQPYLRPVSEVDIIRNNQPYFRDDNFNLNIWSGNAGVTLLSDGDIFTISGTTGTNGALRTSADFGAVPWAVVRAKIGTVPNNTTIDILFTASDSTTQTSTITLSNNWKVYTISLFPSMGKHTTGYKFLNQSATGTVLIDYIVTAGLQPIIFTNQDVETGVTVSNSTTAVNEATFSLRNDGGKYTTGNQALSLFDVVYVYHGYLLDDLQTRKLNKVFGGNINELAPILDLTGDTIQVQCLGWANALNQILVAKEYGSNSDNPSATTYAAIISDIITSFVNNATGYQLQTTYIQTNSSPPVPTYLLFKNDIAFEAIKQCVDLQTAGDPTGSTVYPTEFWVDNSENCHMATIGSWGTDPNPSSYPNALNVGREQIINNFGKNLQDLKNKVHYITAYINPGNRDAFTENNAGSWTATITGSGGSASGPSNDNSAGNFKVGSWSIKAGWSGRTGVQATLTYPSAANLGLDVTKIGGKITPSTLRVQVKSDTPNGGYGVFIIFYTNGSNYFISQNYPVGNDSAAKPSAFNDSTFHLIESSFGQYGDDYVTVGSPNWNNITQIGIQFTWFTPPITASIWLDGLYLEGQNHLVATDSTRQAQYGTRETHISSLKHRDSATEKKLAKAELFRLHNPVIRGSVTVPGIADVLPGQLVTVTASSANLTAAQLRVLQVKQSYTATNFTTTLDLTDDVTSYQTLQLTSMADLLLMQYVPKRISQREKTETAGQPITLSGMQDPTTVSQTQDYPS